MATPLGSAGVRFTPDITAPGNPVFAGQHVRILTNPVSPDWFRTFGTRILAGRDFDARDRGGAPRVVIVNDAFARRYFQRATPLGQTSWRWPARPIAGRSNRRAGPGCGLRSVRDPVHRRSTRRSIRGWTHGC